MGQAVVSFSTPLDRLRPTGSKTTDYSLEDSVLEARNLQDWMFEESRSSLEVLEMVRNQAPEDCRSSLGSDSDSDEVPQGEPVDDIPMDVDFQEDPLEPTSRPSDGLSNTRKARRRRNNRERSKENGVAVPRREAFAASRLKKSSAKSLHTGVDVSTLKPGLKFEDGRTQVYKLGRLKRKGFEVIEWDGV